MKHQLKFGYLSAAATLFLSPKIILDIYCTLCEGEFIPIVLQAKSGTLLTACVLLYG